MCDTCGCEDNNSSFLISQSTFKKNTDLSISKENIRREVSIEKNILEKNDSIASSIRRYLTKKEIFAVNIMSSPGSGKTTILEKTIGYLQKQIPIAVIEGDQHTSNDALRIEALGVPAIQINTNNGCHLEAHMVKEAIQELHPNDNSILFIENIGNLVCPGLFDIGQNIRVVVISTTEGDDKPLKYAYMFSQADVCIINKIDLLPYLPCDIAVLKKNITTISSKIKIVELSAHTGFGIVDWCRFLLEEKVKMKLS